MNATTQEIIDYMNSVNERVIFAYKISEVAKAIDDSSSKGDINSIEAFLTTMEEAWVRTNQDKPAEKMIRTARDNFAFYAYIADHNPSQMEFLTLGPERAYAQKECYGKNMSVVHKIFERRGIDLERDVFVKKVDFSSN